MQNATSAEVKAPGFNSSSHSEEQSDYGILTVFGVAVMVRV